jgi:hypothetical protein
MTSCEKDYQKWRKEKEAESWDWTDVLVFGLVAPAVLFLLEVIIIFVKRYFGGAW